MLSAHWLPSVVRSFVRSVVGTPSRHKYDPDDREALLDYVPRTTVYIESTLTIIVSNAYVLCLSTSVVSLDQLGVL